MDIKEHPRTREYRKFRGTYEHTLDKQGRITLPSRFQRVLAERECDLLIVEFKEDHLVIYPDDVWDRLEQQDEVLDEDDDREFGYLHRRYANILEVDVDQQGRILLSKRALERAGLVKDLILMGAGAKFEIWDAGVFEERCKEWDRAYRANKMHVSAKRERLRSKGE